MLVSGLRTCVWSQICDCYSKRTILVAVLAQKWPQIQSQSKIALW